MVCFSSVHFGDYFSNNNAKNSQGALKFIVEFPTKGQATTDKRMLFFEPQLCVAPKRDSGLALPLLLTVLSFLCSSSFKSFIKNNRNSCSFNFYNNNMLENSLKRYQQYVFHFQTTDPRGLSSGYSTVIRLLNDRTTELWVRSSQIKSDRPVLSEIFLGSVCWLPPIWSLRCRSTVCGPQGAWWRARASRAPPAGGRKGRPRYTCVPHGCAWPHSWDFLQLPRLGCVGMALPFGRVLSCEVAQTEKSA